MIEIEAKMRLDDPDALLAALRAAGAVRVAELTETNTFYDTPDRGLVHQDRALRLRTETTGADTASPATTYTLAHKGPRAPGPLKAREETELRVASAADADRLLRAIGYAPIFTFEKRRTRYTLADCRVELDELPRIGRFVEVEGPSEQAVFAVRENLGLGDSTLIQQSYVALLREHLEESRVKMDIVAFKTPG